MAEFSRKTENSATQWEFFVFSKENLMNDFCLQQIPGGVECELTAERAGAVKPDRL